MTRRLLLVAMLLASGPLRSLAACANPDAVAATRAAAEQACTEMSAGCSTAGSHGVYVSCIAHQAKAAVKNGTLPKNCKGAVVKCAAHSVCGKPGFVVCCVPQTDSIPKCKKKKDAKHCTAAGGAIGGDEITGCSSCCDACPTMGESPAGGASCVTTTTTTTTSTRITTSTTSTTTTMTTATTTTTCDPSMRPVCGGDCMGTTVCSPCLADCTVEGGRFCSIACSGTCVTSADCPAGQACDSTGCCLTACGATCSPTDPTSCGGG